MYRMVILACVYVVIGGTLPQARAESGDCTFELREACFDLNGDGAVDTVTAIFPAGDGRSGPFSVTVGGSTYKGHGEGLRGTMAVVDIDIKDTYKEIAIPEDGPSSDYSTYLFWFDGKVLHYMGSVQVTLKRDVPLYSSENLDELVGTALKGEKGVLRPGFNEFWLELETDSGKKGLITFCEQGVVGGYQVRDTFEGLCFAD